MISMFDGIFIAKIIYGHISRPNWYVSSLDFAWSEKSQTSYKVVGKRSSKSLQDGLAVQVKLLLHS